MNSPVPQVTPNNQKETLPNTGGRVERFNNGNIEVVYPPGWGTSTQAPVPPNNSVVSPTPQTPEEYALANTRATIQSIAGVKSIPETIEEMREAVYITLPKAA